MQGASFPGHFCCWWRAAAGGEWCDPFAGGTALQAAEPAAPCSSACTGRRQAAAAGHAAPVSRREVLLRLQNNLKLRRLRAGDVAGALACAEDMLRIAPDAAALWREAALMNQRLERIREALACLERFLALVPSGAAAEEARQLAGSWRARLN